MPCNSPWENEGERRSLTPWYKLFYFFLLPLLFGVLLLFPSLWQSLAISLMPALLSSLAVSNGAAHRAGALPSLDPWAVLRVGRARALSRSIFCSWGTFFSGGLITREKICCYRKRSSAFHPGCCSYGTSAIAASFLLALAAAPVPVLLCQPP